MWVKINYNLRIRCYCKVLEFIDISDIKSSDIKSSDIRSTEQQL